MHSQTSELRDALSVLAAGSNIRAPLHSLRTDIGNQALLEYAPTGETPARVNYSIPSTLPHTEGHETLLSRFRERSSSADVNRSPSKGMVFNDSPTESDTFSSSTITKFRPQLSSVASAPAFGASLRELDVNVVNQDSISSPPTISLAVPPLKRQNTNGNGTSDGGSKLPMKKAPRMTVAGTGVGDRENLPVPTNFSASVGPAPGRRLRSHGSG